jgi:Immunity protein Imm1
MHEIAVDDVAGRHVVSSPHDLASVLANRDAHDANSFWFSSVDAEYPCLAVMITGQFAVVHWFPAEGNAGHQSLGDDAATGEVPFIENEQGAAMWLPRSAAVGIELALRCVEQFVVDFERPSAVSWFEL